MFTETEMTAVDMITPAKGPLSFPVFRALWIATIISNIGTWMHDVGAGWLMTSLSPSPLLVALVQAATTLPMFLLALPAGALADIVDRRKMLLGAQILGLSAAAALAVLTLQDLTTPWVLLAATFFLGVAAALSAPVFQAIVPELIDKAGLPEAVALNSLGVNIARAIGPALGGVIVAMAGVPAVFALNAVSVTAVLIVLVRWKRAATIYSLPPEHFFGALRAGYRYARHSPAMRLVLIRTLGFFLFSSALWAMLPLVGRRELGLDAAGYGGLLGCMGAGAIVGALLLKKLRKTVSEQAYEDLKCQILDQRLVPGTRLNIDALSRECGISSSPLREALIRLCSDGLVISAANTGFSVAPVPEPEHVRKLMEYRTMIEAYCAREGAMHVPDDTLKNMNRVIDKMASMREKGINYRQYRAYVELDNDFHQLIVDSVDNDVISSAYKDPHLILMVARLSVVPNSNTIGSDAGMAEHLEILHAYTARNGVEAEKAVRKHLIAAHQRMQKSNQLRI